MVLAGWVAKQEAQHCCKSKVFLPMYTMVHLNPWLPAVSLRSNDAPEEQCLKVVLRIRRRAKVMTIFLIFFCRAKELSDKDPLKVYLSTCLLVSHLFFLSEKGINHTRTSPRLCMRCI